MAEVLAKGVNFAYSKRFIEAEYGEAVWTRILQSLPAEARAILDTGVMVHREYPFAFFKAITSSLTKELGSGHDAEVARIYEYIADQSLNKLYKIFFQFTNPAFVIRNYPKLWDKFFNSGTVEVPVAEKGHAILKFIVPEIFLDWLPPACLGFSKKAVEMAGGKNLTISPKGRVMKSGTWECQFELRWDE